MLTKILLYYFLHIFFFFNVVAFAYEIPVDEKHR